MSREYDLQNRLIDYSVKIIKYAESLPPTKGPGILSIQLIKSGTSVALNYAEAQGAESRKDFVHKLKISLKELRETHVNLRILNKLYHPCKVDNSSLQDETEQLIRIFTKSIQTTLSVHKKKEG
ncbi:MAG: four helix bundle protein [Flavobacteriales bacterium]|nr:four helix bundle protein [Flavobacteriales bacterium]